MHLGRKTTDDTVLFKKFGYLQFATGTGSSRALAKRGLIPAAPPAALGQELSQLCSGTERFWGGGLQGRG